MGLDNIQISIFIIGQTGYILLRKNLDLEFRVAAIIAAACSSVYLIIAYYKLGEINQASRILVNSWKEYSTISAMDKKLLSKYLKSFDLLKIHHGTFGYYTKPYRIIIVKKLIFYGTKSIMMLKKFTLILEQLK